MNQEITQTIRRCALHVLIVASALSSVAQAAPPKQATPPMEPEYAQQYFALGSDGALKPLERASPQHQIKNHNFFIGAKIQSVQVIQGPASSVHILPDTHFIVRLDTADMDPSTFIHLVTLTKNENERDLIQSTTQGYIFAGHKTTGAMAEIPLTINKYGSHSFELFASQPLAPGEYAFVNPMGKADCFAVDQKP